MNFSRVIVERALARASIQRGILPCRHWRIQGCVQIQSAAFQTIGKRFNATVTETSKTTPNTSSPSESTVTGSSNEQESNSQFLKTNETEAATAQTTSPSGDLKETIKKVSKRIDMSKSGRKDKIDETTTTSRDDPEQPTRRITKAEKQRRREERADRPSKAQAGKGLRRLGSDSPLSRELFEEV